MAKNLYRITAATVRAAVLRGDFEATGKSPVPLKQGRRVILLEFSELGGKRSNVQVALDRHLFKLALSRVDFHWYEEVGTLSGGSEAR